MAPTLSAGRHRLLVLSFGNFVIGAGAFVVIGVLSPMADGLRISRAEAGSIMTAYALAYMAASPVLVALSGKLDRRDVLMAGLAIFGIAALLTLAAPTLHLVWGARLLAATGAGLFTPVAAAVAAVSSAPAERGRALATVFGGLTLAQVAGVPAGAWLGYRFGWQTAFGLVAVLSALAIMLTARAVPRGLSFQATALGDLGRALKTPAIMLTVTFTATFLGAIYVVYTFLTPLAEAQLRIGADGLTILLAIFGVGAVIGNLLGGRLTDRIGPARTLYLLAAGQIALNPLAALMPGGFLPAAFLVFVWSLGAWSFMVPQQARLIAVAPEAQNVVLALNAACIYLGASLGSALGAAAIHGGGIAAIPMAALAASAFAFVHLAGGAWLTRGTGAARDN